MSGANLNLMLIYLLAKYNYERNFKISLTTITVFVGQKAKYT